MRTLRTAVAAGIASSILLASQAHAEPVYGIVTTQTLGFPALVSFDSTTPGTMSNPLAIQNIVAGQTLRAIDFRPSNGLLYALSTSNTAAQLYTVNLTTGALTTVGNGFAFSGINSGDVSIDFNPVVDRLRVVSQTGVNLRINPNTGAIANTDTNIDDLTSIAGVAYSNNVAGATSTTLYAYDFLTDKIDTIGSVNGTPVSPNSGQVFVVGDSNLFSYSPNIGFDISGVTGIGYASVYDFGLGNYGFYRWDLATGAHTLIGSEAFALLDFSVKTAAVVGSTVPEPDSLALTGLGLTGLVLLGRRRSRRAD